LLEQWRQRRSRIWYWQQVLTAIAVGFTRSLRAHKLLTVRALLVGWFFVWITGVADWVAEWVGLMGRPWWDAFYFPTMGIRLYHLVSDLTPTSGTFADRVQVEIFLQLVGIVTLATASGWLVSRFHRPLHGPMLVADFGSFAVVAVLTWAFVVSAFLPVLFFEPTPFSDPRHELMPMTERLALFVGAIRVPTLLLSFFAGGILLGGFLGFPRHEPQRDHSVVR
jgi:hypothetical protein